MKKKLLAGLAVGFFMTWITGMAEAALLTPVSVTGTGTFNNSVSVLYDNSFPEGTHWQTDTVWWTDESPSPIFTFDYGTTVYVEDIRLSVDSDNSFRVDYSQDNQNWSELLIIFRDYGEITWGMDTMSTVLGDSEYISEIDFTDPISARYLRIYSTESAGEISIGEFQGSGTVPIPSTMLLFGTGIAGLVGTRLRRKKSV